ncbi:hypothetical protein PAPYR_2286 [Paratrimastix pyriformis]|uniref:Uncharacterized protein n=1 Tax=Paratrimastix pyriformis TaxID=342808 RepID=A0ABQ8UV54_9EUKA|nr:hypothetical protein PAPYR_2286 [Paratrimastix pyriformis]
MGSSAAQADEDYDRALTLFRLLKNRTGEASVLLAMSSLRLRHRGLDQARSAAQDALRLFRNQLANRVGEASALCVLGDVHNAGEEYALACDAYLQARKIFVELRMPSGEADVLKRMADYAVQLGILRAALASQAAAASTGGRRALCCRRPRSGRPAARPAVPPRDMKKDDGDGRRQGVEDDDEFADLDLAEPDEATGSEEDPMPLLDWAAARPAERRRFLGLLLRRMGGPAGRLYDEAYGRYSVARNLRGQVGTLQAKAEYQAARNPAAALKNLELAVALAHEADSAALEADSLWLLGRTKGRLGLAPAAEAALNEAYKLYEQLGKEDDCMACVTEIHTVRQRSLTRRQTRILWVLLFSCILLCFLLMWWVVRRVSRLNANG